MMDKCEFIVKKCKCTCNFSQGFFNTRTVKLHIQFIVREVLLNLQEKLFGCWLLISDEIVRQFVYTIKRAFDGWISFVLLNRKLGRALIVCARLVSFKFFFQCKAFWYSFRCLVSNAFCSLHADRCFRSETTSERYFLRNCVSITLYLFVLILVFGIPTQMLDC